MELEAEESAQFCNLQGNSRVEVGGKVGLGGSNSPGRTYLLTFRAFDLFI